MKERTHNLKIHSQLLSKQLPTVLVMISQFNALLGALRGIFVGDCLLSPEFKWKSPPPPRRLLKWVYFPIYWEIPNPLLNDRYKVRSGEIISSGQQHWNQRSTHAKIIANRLLWQISNECPPPPIKKIIKRCDYMKSIP